MLKELMFSALPTQLALALPASLSARKSFPILLTKPGMFGNFFWGDAADDGAAAAFGRIQGGASCGPNSNWSGRRVVMERGVSSAAFVVLHLDNMWARCRRVAC